MAEEYGLIDCDLCSRAFKKYDKFDCSKIFGLSLIKLKRTGTKMEFVSWDKSEINKHICSYCISDILNKFNN